MKKTTILSIVILLSFLPFEWLLAKGSWIDMGEYLEQSETIAPIYWIKYSSDGNAILTFSEDCTLRKWDDETGEIIYEKEIPDCKISFEPPAFDLSSDEKSAYLFSPWNDSWNSKVSLIKWDMDNIDGSPDFDITYNLYYPTGAFIFGKSLSVYLMPGDKELLTIADKSLESAEIVSSGEMDFRDAGSGEKLESLSGGSIDNFAFSKDGNFMAICRSIMYNPQLGNKDPEVYAKLYPKDGESISLGDNIGPYIFMNNSDEMINIQFNNYPLTLPKEITFWDCESGTIEKTLQFDDSSEVDNVASSTYLITHDDRFLVFDSKSQLNIIDLQTEEYLGSIDIPENEIYYKKRHFSAHPLLYNFACGTPDGKLRVYKPGLILNGIEDDFGNEDMALNIFPNPSTGFARLSFTLQQNEMITVDMFDATGMLIERIANDQFSAGKNSIIINPDKSNLQSGVYYIRVRKGLSSITRQLTILR